ncbi:MAG: cobalt chelatase, partial [Desulfobacterota bacterium]|nr:cobalt chelatase [Thermodesulfobacteriota bacterium]
MWDSHSHTLKKVSNKLKKIMEVIIYSLKQLEEEPEKIQSVLKEAETVDAILLYRSTEAVWGMMERKLQEIGRNVPIVCVGHQPSYWTLSTVRPEVVATVYSYITYSGEENFANMLRYVAREVCGMNIEAPLPKLIPW